MRKHIKALLLTGAVGGLLLAQSCTNLDEKVYDQVPTNQFGTNQQQIDALVGPLYTALSSYYQYYAQLNTVTDEQVIPTRGGDWKDGDQWKRLHTHTWLPALDDNLFNGLWTWIYNNVAAINLQLVNPGITSPQTKAELRALRAFYHYVAMDNFGNVLLANTTNADSVQQQPRANVYAFVESELRQVLPLLSDQVGGVQYGRMNKYVAHMILAKLYLNAGVYTGTTQWQKAAAECDSIITSGKFALADDFFSNFSIANENSPEIILATPMDKTKNPQMDIQMRTLHYKSQLTYNLGTQPWNGYCTLAEFYNSFDSSDVRKRMWIVGQQYDMNGDSLYDDNLPMAFTVNIPAFEMPSGPVARLAGARSQKYQIQKNNSYSYQDNDFVIFRLADVYLMRGEANFQLGNVAQALNDINYVRTRRNVAAFTSLAADDILAERGRELAWEYHRRQDLIRFGKYTQPWGFKPVSDPTKQIFPIPYSQLATNPNLKQNPGY